MTELTVQELAEIFGEVVDLSGIQVSERAVLGQDIPLDSREMLRVLSRIESRYRIRLTPEDVVSMKTLGDVLDAVRRRAAKR
jgi:acyl carrier protein